MTNENAVANIHPEVTNFLNQAHTMRAELDDALRQVERQEAMIATLEDQLDGMRDMIKETSVKSDYYMRLCVEMRTHFIAIQSISKEAEKCFNSGPYRNNGAISQEALQMQMVADDINKNGLGLGLEPITENEKVDIEERKQELAKPINIQEKTEIPTFLTDDKRKEKLDKLKTPKNNWGNAK